MLLFENTRVTGFEEAIRGMRNPLNSWAKSDTAYSHGARDDCFIGENDMGLMKKLWVSGTDHRKYLRMIVVYTDIVGPLYWWKEFDTYKVGTVANSCSTMHTIHKKPFVRDDFSIDSLDSSKIWVEGMDDVIHLLNMARECYLREVDPDLKKAYWRNMIQLLPTSFNQKRTVMMNYEVLARIFESRRGHKLTEWSHDFIFWLWQLPYSKLITGELEKD